MSKQVIVYSTPDCVECNYVKQWLEEEKVSFEVRDVMSSAEYQQEVEKYGFLGVPVTVVGDKAVKGFKPELKELLETIEK